MTKRTVQLMIVAAAMGIAIGVGAYTFVYAKGASYLRDDPVACANCHIMNEQYDGWLKSSHRAVATCNDCHTPDGFLAKYANKASNGFWHSFYFTLDNFHEPIQIKPRNLAVTEQSCQKCHSDISDAIAAPHGNSEPTSCVKCHRSVGHLH